MLKFRPQTVWVSGLVLALGCLAYAQAQYQTKRDKMFDLGVALLQYSEDYDEKLPVVTNKEDVQRILGPYVKDPTILVPTKGKNYFAFNFALSGKRQYTLDGKGIVAFYEANPPKNETRGVLFLPPLDSKFVHYPGNSGFVNYYIKEMAKPEWKKFSKEQKLP